MFGIEREGSFLKDGGWGPTFTIFPEDAKKFRTSRDAELYIDEYLGDDFGAHVCHLPLSEGRVVELTESELRHVLTESVKRILSESFSSPLLAKYAKEHGGIKIFDNGGIREFPCAFQHGDSIDVRKITDNMLIGEPYKPAEKYYENSDSIEFNDGTIIKLDKTIEIPKRPSRTRYGSGIGDTGDHDKKSFFGGEDKKAKSAPYNGFSVSNRAGEAQHYREALKNNLDDIKYFETHKEHFSDWADRIRSGKRNIENIKKNISQLKKK